MYTCPSCNQTTISFAKKWLSSSAAPAKCSACGKGCAITVADASTYVVVCSVVITLSGFVTIALHTSIPLVAGVAVSVGYYFWRQHTALLAVVSDVEHRVAKRSAFLTLFLAVFPSFFS